MLAPDQRQVPGSNPGAPKFVSMWDGVSGNASGFELEDEGSTPSPTANLLLIAQGTFDGSAGGNEYGKQNTFKVAGRQADAGN